MDPTADRSSGVPGEAPTGWTGTVATAGPRSETSRHSEPRREDDETQVPDRSVAPERDPAAIAADAAAAAEARRARRSTKAPRRRVSLSELWRSAVTPRMIVLLVLFIGAAVVCVQLSAWQLDRAALRGAERAIAAHEATLAADPAPLEDVLPAQTSFGADVHATGVSVTGQWEPGNEVLVVDRAVEGEPAALFVASLRLTEGPDAGAMIPVLRGWLPADDVAVTDDGAAVDPSALALPAGEVTVQGHLSNSEAVRDGETAPGTVRSISTGALAGEWGGPTFSGYLVQGAHDGEEWVATDGALRQAPDPTIAVDTGFNLQNLAYAVEWLVFGGFALWLWWRLVRDDALDRRDEELLAAEPR